MIYIPTMRHEILFRDKILSNHPPLIGTQETKALLIQGDLCLEENFYTYLRDKGITFSDIDHLILDFPNNLKVDCRAHISACVEAARSAFPEVPVSLFGTPQAPRNFEWFYWHYDPDTVRWLGRTTALSVPDLRRFSDYEWWNPELDAMLATRFSPRRELTTPVMSHLLYPEMDPLDRTSTGINILLKLLKEVEVLGVPKVYWLIERESDLEGLRRTLVELGVDRRGN